MLSQVATGIPFGLCTTTSSLSSNLWFWGDTLEPVDLIGRPFRHGPSGTDGKGDCYALVRDYYRSIEHPIKEYARDDDWWNYGESMYEDFFEDAGFLDVTHQSHKEGDVFMMTINSKAINHAGVYVGNGLILHHLANRLSRREPVGRWPKMIAKWVRYNEFM